MKYNTQIRIIALVGFICFMLVSLSAYAANKTIYINQFVKLEGFSKTDPIGDRIKDFISEAIIANGGYSMTSDEEVKQVMKQEEIRMSLDTCNDDACVKQLMESLRTDLIIYGTVSFEDNRYHITAKILDRSGGTVKLARVKSLQFKDKDKIKMAAYDLAQHLAAGKEIDMSRYDDNYQAVIKEYEKNVPEGLSAYLMYFIPSKAPFKTYYDSLIGVGLDYYMKFGNYLSAGAGLYYVSGDDKSGKAQVSLNSYSISGRAGYPLLGSVYPYIGLSGRVTWFNEKGAGRKANYSGYGGDAFAGCAYMISQTLSVWADYSMSIVKLNDSGNTDISGSAIRVGMMYAF
jgi:hypothetical protein